MSSNYGLVEEQFRNISQHDDIFGEEELGEDGEPVIQTHVNEDGTTSSYFDKRKLKIAPRSTLQFKVGPTFEFVGNYYKVTERYTGRVLDLSIIPRIDRGFDFIDGEWVGYKRNYFTLVSSFEALGWDLDEFLNSCFELHGDTGQRCHIKYFAINIKAKSDDDHTEISLVQHTAKRDKGPQFPPAMAPLIPSALPNHQIIREASNVRNTTKMKKYDATFYFHRDDPVNSTAYSEKSVINSYPGDCIQRVARYERVQFASSINLKKPAQQNRHFRLHVVLGAIIPKGFNHYHHGSDGIHGDIVETGIDAQRDLFIPLQEVRTPPLIIRGRSPSNYTSSQRISVRTSSYNCSYKPEPSVSIGPPNPMLASQNSAPSQTPMTISPNKPRPGRPSKRKSRVLYVPPPLGSPPQPLPQLLEPPLAELLHEEPPSAAVLSIAKKVETLENIENFFHTQGPLALKTLDHQNFNPDMEDKTYKPTLLSRQNSVDPRDIELKCDKEFQENLRTVGPLQILATLKSQNSNTGKPDDNNKNNYADAGVSRKKRKLNGTSTTTALELSLEDTKELFDDDALKTNVNYAQSDSPVSPLSSRNIEPNPMEELSFGEGLNSISFSLLADSSSNYCHVPNTTLSEMENVPRIFDSRVIGAQDTSNRNDHNDYNKDSSREQTTAGMLVSKEARDAMNGLPSQMADMGELYEELSFYRH
ncbi:ZYRO0G06160p [Zygosaccharomyces rouxii]|uniref:ZYRO0G06160p n=1 Tax=Zygosaccharomyces rouxii (strain ATCC 2623 / CBS 732 / NBRC 1130 / NCYC 568 / NRRL Y-229) TaxID=559307 RepID=C5DZP5_ZYGRC|nr:uncharacterized protein ZYRO0G06160g [Zygosaccharomyces rouxii]KAH9202327.1 hypothetical protein LQ764DRAFT_174959 [Zygosaccharomyces rouxii]CAR29329.1 ZYRO0G06160p [Zygosaccharomyces rouxii]